MKLFFMPSIIGTNFYNIIHTSRIAGDVHNAMLNAKVAIRCKPSAASNRATDYPPMKVKSAV